MSEKVDIDINLNGGDKAATSVAALRKAIKAAESEAIRLSREFGELSPQAQAAVKKVSELKDEINDMNERVNLADPGAKFAVFGNAVQAVAAGFTAAQGAMALFGAESEDLQKQLVKLQGALALSQGLSTIADSWKDFQRLGAVIKAQVIPAFTTLRGAIIATGIGALAVALGAIIENFQDIDKWLQKVIPGFEGFGKVLDKLKAVGAGVVAFLVQQFRTLGEIIGKVLTGDFSGAAQAWKDSGKKAAEAFYQGFNEEINNQRQKAAAKMLNDLNATLERELKVRKAYGQKTTAQEEEIARNNAAAKMLEFGADSHEYLDAQADFNALIAGNRKAAADKAREDAKKSAEQRMKDLQQEQAIEYAWNEQSGKNIYDLKLRQLNEQKELAQQLGLETKDVDYQIQLATLDQRKELNAALAEDVRSTSGVIKSELSGVGDAQAALTARQVAAIEERIRKEREAAEITRLAEEARQIAMSTTTDALGAASQLAGEQTAVGKGLAIAQTTISTYQGAQQAFTSFSAIPIVGTALGIAAAAAAVISGIARVKQIASVKVPGAISGGMAMPSAPLQSTPSLQMNTSTLVDQAMQQNSNLRQPQRVYVLETDITDTQDRVAKIEANAQF